MNFAIALLLMFAQAKTDAPLKLLPGVYAVFDTSMGTFTCQLFDRQAPQNVTNFTELAEGKKDYKDDKTGKLVHKPYYDGAMFHRVLDGFMIQAGDYSGRGTGMPGYWVHDEISPQLKFDQEGRLAMANTGPNTNGSQIFITLGKKPDLDKKYTIIGQVIEGMDVVRKIGKTPVKTQPYSTEKSRPVTAVTIRKVTVKRVKAQ